MCDTLSSSPPSASGFDLETFRARIAKHMAEKGLRSTEQRYRIAEALFAAKGHVSIEELLASVRTHDPRIGHATVYRTLKLLTEAGLAFEHHFSNGFARYELGDLMVHHHDHLICSGCGKIQEFEEPRIEAMQEEIATCYGFKLQSHKHELYGLCPACHTP